MSVQTITHYGLHYLFTGVIAFAFFRPKWLKVWGILVLTMLVDLDHFLADPVFKPDRCSIGFHPLHTYYAIAVYVGMLLLPRTWRIVGIGLLFHMVTDFIDCLFMYGRCPDCYEGTVVYPVLKWVGDLIFS